MRRFFVENASDGEVLLEGQEARHIARVLRMQEGDRLILFDGSGIDYSAQILRVGADSVALKILSGGVSAAEPKTSITLYQAVIKSDHFDYAVQKCTELGVSKIVPFISERCVKRPKSEQNFLERECRIALEAAKQCGRSRIPEVAGIIDFNELIHAAENGMTLLAYEDEHNTTIKQAVRGNNPESISVIVGPEGGFAEHEAEMLCNAGAKAVSLGKLILRAETAGVAAVAMIQYEYGM